MPYKGNCKKYSKVCNGCHCFTVHIESSILFSIISIATTLINSNKQQHIEFQIPCGEENTKDC